jgi:hypothetical protein
MKKNKILLGIIAIAVTVIGIFFIKSYLRFKETTELTPQQYTEKHK